MSYGQTGVVVRALKALWPVLPSPEHLLMQHYLRKKDYSYPFQPLIESLQQIGFDGTDIVEDVGHYAIRGGIIDIFPWTKSRSGTD